MWLLPYMLFRGGTSKGPFFVKSMIPRDPALRDKILLSLMGSPHEIQVDGIGGGHALSNKACIVGASKRLGVDIDYLICQVHVNRPLVETTIDCGNMLAAVAPFAIESGLIKASDPETNVIIYSENTGVLIESIVPTPGGAISYKDSDSISSPLEAGVSIKLNFLKPAGTTTGKMLPTGSPLDIIQGIQASCIDVSMPMVITESKSFGKTGYESKRELDSDKTFMDKLEAIRREAAIRMGLGDVTGKTMPKICIVSPPTKGGNISARYMIAPFDYDCHPSFAVTGAMCLAAGCYIKGTLANKCVKEESDIFQQGTTICIEHPSGKIEASVDFTSNGDEIKIDKVSYVRTARPLSKGEVYVPGQQPNEYDHIVKLQAHMHGLFQRKKFEREISQLKEVVISNFDEAVKTAIRSGNADLADSIKRYVHEKRYVEAFHAINAANIDSFSPKKM